MPVPANCMVRSRRPGTWPRQGPRIARPLAVANLADLVTGTLTEQIGQLPGRNIIVGKHGGSGGPIGTKPVEKARP